MKIVMGGIAQTTPIGTSVTITGSTSDPVPTCQISLYDNASTLQALAWQEILILDDVQIPNPTVNLLLNPTLNPYTTSWTTGYGGYAYSQPGGGGVTVTATNMPFGSGNEVILQTTSNGSVVPGQTYVLSFYAQATSPVAIAVSAQIGWNTASGGSAGAANFLGSYPMSTSLTRYSLSAVAPANTGFASIALSITANNATNSVNVTFTQVQFEPLWFSALSYPTPFCGPSQTNCRQLPLGQYIRQYRKFAGFVTGAEYGGYIGNVRTISVSGSGYAILLSTIYSNKTYTSQYDSVAFINLCNSYLTSQPPNAGSATNMVDTTNVIQGVQLSNFAIPWDDIRTTFNNLASQIGWYWSIGWYWDAIYAPLGYFSAVFSLIADDSATPDNLTTFPVQNFKTTMDATQPGSNILILGNGSNTAQVIDPAQINAWGVRSGYFLPPLTSWMRKVNESSLNSTTDCTNRGIAELIQYDYERYIYTLTTNNVELVPGYGVQVTSATDNLNKTTLLLQQVKATWIGKNELLTDVWTYDATLGAINRSIAQILSRLARASNSNSSATAIAIIALVVFEKLGVIESSSTSGMLATGYQATILADNPLAYHRLDELLGTIADDFSGNAYAGTLHGGVTLNATGLLHSGGDPAMSFDGSSGYISLPTSFVPTGAHAWSLECWAKVSSFGSSGTISAMVAMGTNSTQESGQLKTWNNSGTTVFLFDTYNAHINSGAVTTGTIYHVVGTYDGTNVRLYINGSLVAGPTAIAVNIIAAYASIGADGTSPGEFYNGTLDEVAIYNYALNATQISNHYTVGST